MCNKTGSCKSCCTPAMIGKILLIIGGVNWGLVGIALLIGNDSNWNVVNLLLGSWPVVEGIVYVLVGAAAVMKIFGCKCKKCMDACGSCNSCGSDGSDGSGHDHADSKVSGNM